MRFYVDNETVASIDSYAVQYAAGVGTLAQTPRYFEALR
jgi:hypothetical protein